MANIPGTSVKVVFIAKPVTGYAPIFYEPHQGLGTMLSVNAGNSIDLYVGGGGINGGFNYALQSLQNTSEYQTRHKTLLAQSRSGGGEFEGYAHKDPTRFSLVYDKPLTSVAGYHDGLCFVDIFGHHLHPNENVNNAGMLYVAPPFGGNYTSETDFLDAIKQTAANVITSVGKYNAIAKEHQVPEIKVLRLCLFSSGIYNTQNISWDKIATAIFEGLRSILENDDKGLAYLEFPYNNPLFYSVKNLIGNDS